MLRDAILIRLSVNEMSVGIQWSVNFDGHAPCCMNLLQSGDDFTASTLRERAPGQEMRGWNKGLHNAIDF